MPVDGGLSFSGSLALGLFRHSYVWMSRDSDWRGSAMTHGSLGRAETSRLKGHGEPATGEGLLPPLLLSLTTAFGAALSLNTI